MAVIIQLGSDGEHVADASALLAPEKIILLSKRVDCLNWGDFLEQEAQQAKIALVDQDINNPLSVTFSKHADLYWVHIPPLPDQQAANREINKLRNLGIASFRVEEHGVWLNAISFSMLHDRAASQKLLLELQTKGVAEARIKERNIQLQKIVIHEPDEKLEIKLQDLVEKYPGSELVHATCKRL